MPLTDDRTVSATSASSFGSVSPHVSQCSGDYTAASSLRSPVISSEGGHDHALPLPSSSPSTTSSTELLTQSTSASSYSHSSSKKQSPQPQQHQHQQHTPPSLWSTWYMGRVFGRPAPGSRSQRHQQPAADISPNVNMNTTMVNTPTTPPRSKVKSIGARLMKQQHATASASASSASSSFDRLQQSSHLINVKCADLAEQLTLRLHYMYCCVSPQELIADTSVAPSLRKRMMSADTRCAPPVPTRFASASRRPGITLFTRAHVCLSL